MVHLPHFGQKVVAIADIESGSVAVAIVLLSTKGPAKILARERRFLALEERASKAVIAGLMTQLTEAAEKATAAYGAQKQFYGHVTAVHAIVRAPWTRSKTVRITSDLAGEKLITDTLINDLAQTRIAQDTEFNKENVFETSVVRVDLNGYPCASPLGKRAGQISVVVLMSHCDPGLRQILESTLGRIFPGSAPLLQSGTRAIVSALGTLSDYLQKYVVVDIGTTYSSMTSIREDLSLEYGILPEGSRTALKRVSGDSLVEDKLTLLRMLEHQDCTSDACNALRSDLARIEPDLVRVFGEGFSTIAPNNRLPNTLVLVVDPDFATWLSSFFSRIDFTQFTASTQPFMVKILTPKDLEKNVLDVARDSDIGISIASALVNSESITR